LALIAKSRLQNVQDGLIKIGILINNNSILAAHLRDHMLDSQRISARFRSQFNNVQTRFFASGESDHGHLRVSHKVIADFCACSGEKIQHPRGRFASLNNSNTIEPVTDDWEAGL